MYAHVRVVLNKTFFCYLALQPCNNVFLIHISLFSESHVFSNCGVDYVNHKCHHSGMPFLLVYTRTPRIVGDFIKIYHRDSDGEKCLDWLRDCWNHEEQLLKHSTTLPRLTGILYV